MPTSFVVPDRLPKHVRRPDLLLHPQIPVPLHGTAPRVVMPNVWWTRTRRVALSTHGHFCWACGYPGAANPIRQIMDVHECYDIDYRRGRMVFKEAVVLCYFCHSFIHLGRTSTLIEKGEITRRVGRMIVRHCQKILREAKLPIAPNHYSGPTAPPHLWRLVVEGKEYPPVVKL